MVKKPKQNLNLKKLIQVSFTHPGATWHPYKLLIGVGKPCHQFHAWHWEQFPNSTHTISAIPFLQHKSLRKLVPLE
jgi:hypothetical protein